MPDNVKTDEHLLRLLQEAAGKQLSAQEVRDQRVSFILGNMPKDSTVTREEVAAVLNNIEGTRAG